MKKNKTQQHAATQGTQHEEKQNTTTRKQKVNFFDQTLELYY